MTPPKSTKTKINFEKLLAELETIVHRLEEEEVPLETSLKLFADGQRLARECEAQLTAAENQVRKLIETPAGVDEVPLDDDDIDSGNDETDSPASSISSAAPLSSDADDEADDDEDLGGARDRGRLPF